MTRKASGNFSQNQVALQHKIAYAAILISTLSWCCLFLSAPFLTEGGPLARKMASVITLFFSPVCHQAPDRSLHLLGHPLAVCARCTGIYGGFLLGVAIYPFFRKLERQKLPPRWVLGGAVLPTGVEGFLSWGRVIPPDPFLRSLTGLFLGAVVAFYVLPAVFELVNIRHKP